MIEIKAESALSDIDRAKAQQALIADAMRTAHPAFLQVSVMLDQWVKRNFQTQGGNIGGWVPFAYGGRLAPKEPGKRGGVYAKRGGKRPPAANAKSDGRWINTSAMMLQDTGALRMSTLPFATAAEAGVGSFLPYAKTHQEGEGVPQRRILPEREEVLPQAVEIFERWVRVRVNEIIPGAMR